MAHQSLDHSEILNVRWATVDPNPAAQKREARRIEEQAADAIRAALPADFVAEMEGRDPEARKRRRVEGGFGLQGYEAPDEVWFAAEKARVDGGGQLEAPEERYLIEGGEDVEGEEDMVVSVQQLQSQQQQQQDTGGILSGSTLAALKGYKVNTAKKPEPAKGPLVGYGSDDSDDD